MLVRAVFHDEDGSPNRVECEVYEGEKLTTVWVHIGALDAVTRF